MSKSTQKKSKPSINKKDINYLTGLEYLRESNFIGDSYIVMYLGLYLNGYTYRDIAKKFNISVGTVSYRLHKIPSFQARTIKEITKNKRDPRIQKFLNNTKYHCPRCGSREIVINTAVYFPKVSFKCSSCLKKWTDELPE